jgi:hypothetical protein
MVRQIQILIIILGLISTSLGIWTMLQIPTIILSPWSLVAIFLPLTLFIALLIGYLTKVMLNSGWHTMTFAALIMTGICLAFYARQFKPSYKIVVPDNYVGEVRLLVSHENQNDFEVNSFGIGYITQNLYKNGFRPKVIKGGLDISDHVSGYSTGSYETTSGSKLSFDYLSFEIPGKKEVTELIDFDSLVKLKAIDTARLRRK